MNLHEEGWDDERALRGAILEEPIKALEPADPICVSPQTSYREAIEAMNAVKLGCVFVTEDERLIGILTERDILRHVVGKADLESPVSQSMTKNPETVRMDDLIAFALNKMATGGYRSIPVVDEMDRPVGLVTVRHFVRFIVTLFPAAVLNLPPDPQLSIASTAEGA
jgi:CBS domain-containing protein